MNENLDLTELLKDCLKGTKFYSPIYGEVEFLRIEADDYINPITIKWTNKNGNSYIEYLTKEGTFRGLGECIIFPSKDQRDWSKWHIPFKDGDIAVSKSGNLIGIVKISCSDDDCYGVYVVLDNWGEYPIIYDDTKIYFSRLATKEEKQLLFEAIKANGYKWDFKTKTLEKLIVPKFKVGDRIKHRLTGDVYKVVFILSNECGGGVYNVLTTNEIGKIIYIKEQDNYELIPDKFNPKFFKPLCTLENSEFTVEVIDDNTDLLNSLMGVEVEDYTYTIESKNIDIPPREILQALMLIEFANIGNDGEVIKIPYYDIVMLAKGHCIFEFKNYTMEWKDINENKPIDGARVLVCDTYYKRVTIAIYNENNESWDNEEEDISYKLSRCPYWTELPKFKDINS